MFSFLPEIEVNFTLIPCKEILLGTNSFNQENIYNPTKGTINWGK